jgi:hypothetical protein
MAVGAARAQRLLWVADNVKAATLTGRPYLQGGKRTPQPLLLARHAGRGPSARTAIKGLPVTVQKSTSEAESALWAVADGAPPRAVGEPICLHPPCSLALHQREAASSASCARPAVVLCARGAGWIWTGGAARNDPCHLICPVTAYVVHTIGYAIRGLGCTFRLVGSC